MNWSYFLFIEAARDTKTLVGLYRGPHASVTSSQQLMLYTSNAQTELEFAFTPHGFLQDELRSLSICMQARCFVVL